MSTCLSSTDTGLCCSWCHIRRPVWLRCQESRPWAVGRRGRRWFLLRWRWGAFRLHIACYVSEPIALLHEVFFTIALLPQLWLTGMYFTGSCRCQWWGACRTSWSVWFAVGDASSCRVWTGVLTFHAAKPSQHTVHNLISIPVFSIDTRRTVCHCDNWAVNTDPNYYAQWRYPKSSISQFCFWLLMTHSRIKPERSICTLCHHQNRYSHPHDLRTWTLWSADGRRRRRAIWGCRWHDEQHIWPTSRATMISMGIRSCTHQATSHHNQVRWFTNRWYDTLSTIKQGWSFSLCWWHIYEVG